MFTRFGTQILEFFYPDSKLRSMSLADPLEYIPRMATLNH